MRHSLVKNRDYIYPCIRDIEKRILACAGEAVWLSMLEDVDQKFIEKLRQNLGMFGFQWLCACAVYPDLRFPLTVHLGRRLAEAVDRPVPDEEEHMALCSLPWFRHGRMPDGLRFVLLQALLPENRQTVREAIKELFDIAIDQKRDTVTGKPAMAHDVMFNRYMMGIVPTETDLRLDRRLRRKFSTRLSNWLDQRMLTTIVLVLAAIGLAWIIGG